MYKERIKSILLVFLVFTNFVLGSKILIDKKLWPDGYNFFYNVGITKLYSNIVSYFSDDEAQKTKAFTPDKIIINTGDQTTRVSLNSNYNEFWDIYEEAEKILKSAFSSEGDKISEVSVEEIYSVLSSGSVYLDYSANNNTRLFGEYLENKSQPIEELVTGFSGLIIEYLPKTNVYIADIDSGKYFKISVSKNIDALDSMLKVASKKYSQYERPVINYSFELKFDRPFGTQKTTLNPLIQIYSTTTPYSIIKASNPLLESDLSVKEIVVDEILKAFSINPNTMRRYQEAGGALVFVENNAILKINKDGYLEYEAIATDVKSSVGDTKHSGIVNALSLIKKVNEAIDLQGFVQLSDTPEENTLNFDYVTQGVKVKIENERISSAIELVMEGGYIKSYKQLMRNYTVMPQMSYPTEFFTALDGAIGQYSQYLNEIKIDKMYISYTDDGSNGEKLADWTVDINNVIVGE